ncbi:hypothetical protein FVE85_2934 [Porphyridium purpureum]|uniref:Uncharacterized protein n=1 Tax=Porphyridium purpureum TaxID=35688 RepID=A0A5J4YVE5_PORPP|nr:hypothetical protein FVE85_2934 [Porphyridium purpureum]|eukprot:POR0904..scf227_4
MAVAHVRVPLVAAGFLICAAFVWFTSGLQKLADDGGPVVSRLPAELIRGTAFEVDEEARRARVARNPWVTEYQQSGQVWNHWDAEELRRGGFVPSGGEHDAFSNAYRIREPEVTVDASHGVEWVRHVIVVGCGGTFRPSARTGDRVEVRYVAEMRGRDARAVAPTPVLNVSFVLGAKQPFRALQSAIGRMCPGEIAELVIPSWVLRILPGAHHIPSFLKSATPLPRRGGLGPQLHIFVQLVSTARATESMDEFEEAQVLAARILAIAGAQGESCDSACARNNATCLADAFKVVNECPRIKTVFPCTVCEVAAKGSAGPDMPCFVSPSAPIGHPRGYCMATPNVAVSDCAGRYPHTSRVCPCEPLLTQS